MTWIMRFSDDEVEDLKRCQRFDEHIHICLDYLIPKLEQCPGIEMCNFICKTVKRVQELRLEDEKHE